MDTTDALTTLRTILSEVGQEGHCPDRAAEIVNERMHKLGFTQAAMNEAAERVTRENDAENKVLACIDPLAKALGLKPGEDITVGDMVQRAFDTENEAALAIVEQMNAAIIDCRIVRGELPAGGTA